MKPTFIKRIGPGILVAATGVGAGDLATAAFTGSKLGLSILWVVIVGAIFKYVLNEGLARWQLYENSTLLEGAFSNLPRIFLYFFILYFILWCFPVSTALMSACGVSLHAVLPIFDSVTDKIIYGVLCSITGLLFVRLGGFILFEKIMSVSIAIMFITVALTAFLLKPDISDVLSGLFIPTIPTENANTLSWIIALIGGIGGTVTILSYSYWMRESGRVETTAFKDTRFDLAVAYGITAVFGIAMVIIGSHVNIDGGGSKLIVQLASTLEDKTGTLIKWLFLIGAFGAIFSSLLGVWQGVPYLFADMMKLFFSTKEEMSTSGTTYRYFQIGLAIIPIFGLWIGFASMQKLYAVLGALFVPMLAATLLYLGLSGKAKTFSNKPLNTVLLTIVLLFFLFAGWLTLQKVF